MFAYCFKGWNGKFNIYQHPGINDKAMALKRNFYKPLQPLFIIYVAM